MSELASRCNFNYDATTCSIQESLWNSMLSWTKKCLEENSSTQTTTWMMKRMLFFIRIVKKSKYSKWRPLCVEIVKRACAKKYLRHAFVYYCRLWNYVQWKTRTHLLRFFGINKEIAKYCPSQLHSWSATKETGVCYPTACVASEIRFLFLLSTKHHPTLGL